MPPTAVAPARTFGAAAWLGRMDAAELPLLAATRDALDEWREQEDAADAHLLSPLVADDPLATLRLLRHVARLRAGREGGHPETVTEAMVMLGIPPLFRLFPAGERSAEEALAAAAEPEAARDGFEAVLLRARRAARFALGFAVHRQDMDAAVIHQAALLHDFAELLLWLEAPAVARTIADRLKAEPGLRSAQAQRDLLGVGLAELQQALMTRWRLPELLVRISADEPTRLPQVRNVQLAIRLARHSARGWDDPALPDDLAELAGLLHLSPDHAQALAHAIDGGEALPS